jgi:vinculin
LIQVAQGLQGEQRAEILALCNQVDSLSRQLGDLCRSGQGNSPQAQAVAKYDIFVVTDFKIF